jgi:hypothetical protein
MAFLPNRAHDIPFALVSGLDGGPLTGASPTGYRVIDGGSQTAVGGAIVERGNGQYLFEGVQADFTAQQSVGLLFTSANAIPAHVLVMVDKFHRNTAYDIPFALISTTVGTGVTGASPSGLRIVDGGAQAAVDGTFVERGNGQYVFQAAASDFAATDIVGFLITAANAMPVHLIIDLVRVLAQTQTLGESPASVLAQWIINQAYMTLPSSGTTWPLYISYLPDGDDVEDDCGAIYDTTPIKDGRLMSGPIVQHYGVQLTIRSTGYDDGWDKINAISAAMDAINLVTVTRNSVDYLLETVTRTGVNSLGVEPDTTKRRYLFTANFVLTMREI